LIKVLEGSKEGIEGSFLIEFPTMEAAKNWYNSPQYQAAAAHRKNGAVYNVTLFQGN
jgi:uncharacterized protein (DUF1330 family)